MAALNNDQITEALYQLLNAPDKQQVQHLLNECDWLTSDEADAKLTRLIAHNRRAKKLPDVNVYTAARGLLRRCRSAGVDTALEKQPDWPLASKGPLVQFLALYERTWLDVWRKRTGTAPKETEVALRIQRASLALQDVDPTTEPDIYSLILGLSYHANARPELYEVLIPDIECFESVASNWTVEESLVATGFVERVYHNLAHLYLHRPRGSRAQNVEKSLYWLQRAREWSEAGSPEHVDVLILIGNAYLGRVVDERLNNIEQGIYYYEKAHSLAEWNKYTKRLGEIEHNLATAYRLRLQGPRKDNYEQAKTCADEALKRFDRRKNREEWARTMTELATIYAHRQVGDRADNLEKAIQYAEQALEIYQADPDSRQWALLQLNLGNLYCDRMRGPRTDNYRKAIAHFETVLDQRDRASNPLGWAETMNNLGTAYAGLSARPLDSNHRQAVDCFRQALKVRSPKTLPAEALQTAANWGNLAFRFEQWNEAFGALKAALKAGEILYQASSSEAGRRLELAESAGLSARAAFCLLKLNHLDQALLQLEQGKTRLLGEALALGAAGLDKLPAEQQPAARKLRQVWEEMRRLRAELRLRTDTPARRSDLELAKQLGEKHAELGQYITDIRKANPDFMPAGLDLDRLLELIPPGGAMVAPVVTSQGSAVFVLPHDAKTVEAEHVISPELLTFTEADLNALLIGSQTKPGWLAYISGSYQSDSDQDWLAAIDTFTSQLWDFLMGPIHKRLAELGVAKEAPVILMPQGGLGLLPLHAAWREVNGHKRAFLDDYVVTYAPSGYALSVSRRRLSEERPQQLSLLAVVNPTQDLTFAPVEGEAVVALFPTAMKLLDGQATPAAVIKNTPDRTHLHFSCHGFYNWEEVMHSGLRLAGGKDGTPLTLAEIISKLDLNTARLVTLSACETGLTEFQKTPDEYIGLPAGFLQAGAPGVISTLWAVDDRSTALLMKQFYAYHLIWKFSPAAALRKAQIWLRDLTLEDFDRQLEDFEQHIDDLKRNTRSSPIEGERRSVIEDRRHNTDDRLYANAYYWAAFTFTGV